MLSLVNSGIALRTRSYEETARKAIGLRGEQAVLVAQFGSFFFIIADKLTVKTVYHPLSPNDSRPSTQAYDFGAAIVYLVIVGDTGVSLASQLGVTFYGLRQTV